jgi:uncharacterized membrane protein
MEICILKFDGRHGAEDALSEMLDAEGDRNHWLVEVGTVSRPLNGRVRISATFPDGQSKTFHEGDLARAVADLGAYTGYYVSALVGLVGSMFGTVDAASKAGSFESEAEQRSFHLDDIKKVVPRDSSALLLIANEKTCDAMVAMFRLYDPTVIRRDVGDELGQRLEALQLRVTQHLTQAQTEGAPASH